MGMNVAILGPLLPTNQRAISFVCEIEVDRGHPCNYIDKVPLYRPFCLDTEAQRINLDSGLRVAYLGHRQ